MSRPFKTRQSDRLHYLIIQEEIESQRLRDEQEQAEARLQNQLDALEAIERATQKAFASIENQASEGGAITQS
jgi:hypothetical protein